MSVYVDPLQPTLQNNKWRYNEGCHLLADTIEELHSFAEKIGMKRSWFQNPDHALPHYDLTRGKRLQAIKLGAIEIGREKVSMMMQDIRRIATETGA